MPVRTKAQPYGSESVIKHDSFGYSRVSCGALRVVSRLGAARQLGYYAANRQQPIPTPSSHALCYRRVSPIIALTTPLGLRQYLERVNLRRIPRSSTLSLILQISVKNR
jgi:hypothetical protein